MPKMHSQIIQESGKICKANGLGRDFIFFFSLFCEMVCRQCIWQEKKVEFDLKLAYILAQIIIGLQYRKITACL